MRVFLHVSAAFLNVLFLCSIVYGCNSAVNDQKNLARLFLSHHIWVLYLFLFVLNIYLQKSSEGNFKYRIILGISFLIIIMGVKKLVKKLCCQHFYQQLQLTILFWTVLSKIGYSGELHVERMMSLNWATTSFLYTYICFLLLFFSQNLRNSMIGWDFVYSLVTC